MSHPAYIYFNGEIVPYDEARIHVSSPAAMYGIGVFEGIRGYWNDADREMYVFRLRDHVERLSVEAVQREMDRTEIYTADEAFICGTLAEVTPIVSLDGLPVGDGTVGPVTRALQKYYRDVAQCPESEIRSIEFRIQRDTNFLNLV